MSYSETVGSVIKQIRKPKDDGKQKKVVELHSSKWQMKQASAHSKYDRLIGRSKKMKMKRKKK